MLEYLGLALATLTLVLYMIKMWWVESGDSDYWTKLGFPKIKNTISLFDLLSGRKSNRDADLEHYKALGKERYGGVIEFGNPLLLVKDLDLARDIFIKNFDHFFDRRDLPSTDPLFSNSLFLMKGQVWKDMRAFLSPTFTSGRIRGMFPHFKRSSKNLKSYLATSQSPHSRKGGVEINLNEAMRKFTADVICETAFGMNSDVFSNPESEFFKMAENLGNFSLGRKIRVAVFQMFPKLASFVGLSTLPGEVSTYFGGLLRSVLRARERSDSQNVRQDFLQLIVQARKGALVMDESELSRDEKEEELLKTKDNVKPNNVTWSEDVAISQCFLFLLAGFDTVANNLAVAVYLLAAHPEIQERVREEVVRIWGTGEDITYEDVNAMGYLDTFISETLRLYPPVSRLERKCMMDYPIPGSKHVIPRGTIVAFPAEGIHYDEKYWPNPMEFDPDRFKAENKAIRNSYAYMPFGIGPRSCIAMRFALVETKAALANIVKDFQITMTDCTLGPVRDLFGYRVPSGSRIRFIPRK